VGSGTGDPSGPASEEVTGVEVEVKLDLLTAVSSDEGQPAIPRNIIKTHKNIINFFMLFLLYYKNEIK
jgi:hypothetical protein